jgi:transcriptional regulator with XRE-family HTH domain
MTPSPEQIQQLGSIIKTVRERLEISLRRLAEIADVRREYLRNLEEGRAEIKRGNVFRISRSLIFTKKEREIVYEIVKKVCEPRRVHRRHLFIHRKKALPRKMVGGRKFGRLNF